MAFAAPEPDPDVHIYISDPSHEVPLTLINPTLTENNVVEPRVPAPAPAPATSNVPATANGALPYG